MYIFSVLCLSSLNPFSPFALYWFNLFLLFKFPGNEEVKLAILLAISFWAARSADAVQADMVSFISSGLKEKEVLRRGYLRCLRVICKNADTVLRVTLSFQCVLR